jgi:hypothetical protein
MAVALPLLAIRLDHLAHETAKLVAEHLVLLVEIGCLGHRARLK